MTQSKKWLSIAFVLLPCVTAVDFLTGFEFQYSIFYLVPIYLTTWFSGWRLGALISLISVLFSLTGDLASGAHYYNELAPWWNCGISSSFYLSMVWTLHKLRQFQRHLEGRVLERTAALREEIQERKRLGQALLDVSEREQRRIGHDLHDSLCQHLTSAALAGQVLGEKLRHKHLEEAADSDQLVGIIEDGIDLARSLARGLAPVELDVLGLTAGLRELARTTTLRARIPCTLEASAEDARLDDSEAVTHLFRIAQEAVNNAIRHGGATKMRISLRRKSATQGVMEIGDNGRGFTTGQPDGTNEGIGLRVMEHRAHLIGGELNIQASKGRGVRVVCHFPLGHA